MKKLQIIWKIPIGIFTYCHKKSWKFPRSNLRYFQRHFEHFLSQCFLFTQFIRRAFTLTTFEFHHCSGYLCQNCSLRMFFLYLRHFHLRRKKALESVFSFTKSINRILLANFCSYVCIFKSFRSFYNVKSFSLSCFPSFESRTNFWFSR